MAPKQKQVGWMVETTGGLMFWPLPDHAEALAYCEDFAVPVELWASVKALKKHEAAQATEGNL